MIDSLTVQEQQFKYLLIYYSINVFISTYSNTHSVFYTYARAQAPPPPHTQSVNPYNDRDRIITSRFCAYAGGI